MPRKLSLIPPWGGDPQAISEDDPELATLRLQGWKEESKESEAERTYQNRLQKDTSKLETIKHGIASGATVGFSDKLASADEQAQIARERAANPHLYLGSQILGGVVTSAATGGLGTEAAAAQFGARTAVGRTIAAAGAAGGETFLQGVGHYIGDAAIENKPITAEGAIMAGLRDAPLGVAGGVVGHLSQKGAQTARRLFPKSQITKQAVEAAETEAVQAFGSTLDDSNKLLQAADSAIEARNLAAWEARQGSLAGRATRNTESIPLARPPEPNPWARTDLTLNPSVTPDVPAAPLPASAFEPPALPVRENVPTPLPKDSLEAQLTESILAGKPGATAVQTADDAVAGIFARNRDELGRFAKGKAPEAPAPRQRRAKGGAAPEPSAASAPAVEAADDSIEALLARTNQRLESGESITTIRPPKPARVQVDDVTDDAAVGIAKARDEFLAARDYLPDVLGNADFHKPAVTAKPTDAALDDILGSLTRKLEGKGAAEAYGAGAGAPSLQEALERNLRKAPRGRVPLESDLVSAIPAIRRFEQAEANLLDALGDTPGIPTGSVDRVAQWRTASQDVSTKATQRAVNATDAMEVALPGAVEKAAADDLGDAIRAVNTQENAKLAADVVGLPNAPADAPARTQGIMGRAADVGTALELLNAMGVTDKTVGDLPVIGPLLRVYLLARTKAAAFRRVGGKLGMTAETSIAAKSSQVRDRMRSAVRSAVGVGAYSVARGAANVARAVPSAAAVLHRPLFSDETDTYRPPADSTSAGIWQRRESELRRANMPGAIAKSIRAASPSLDPELLDGMIATSEKIASYLYEAMPKAPPNWGFGKKVPPWQPPESEQWSFARVVDAVRNPADVLASAATGDVGVEQMEAIRACYPLMYAEAQVELLTCMQEVDDVPHEKRVQLGTLFQCPLDPTQEPDFGARQQAGFAPAPPAEPAPPAGAQPSPGITAPITLSKSVAPSQGRAI